MWNLIKNYIKKDLKRTVGSDIQEIFSELSPEKVVYTKKLGGYHETPRILIYEAKIIIIVFIKERVSLR